MLPEGGPQRINTDDARVVQYLDELLASVPAKERMLMRCLFVLFEVQMLATQPLRPKRFSHASLEERTANLMGWDTSNIHFRRVAFQALRSLVLWAYVDNPDVARDLGVKPGTDIIKQRNQQRNHGTQSSAQGLSVPLFQEESA